MFLRSSWSGPLLGKTIVSKFIYDCSVSIKASMSLLAILAGVTLICSPEIELRQGSSKGRVLGRYGEI